MSELTEKMTRYFGLAALVLAVAAASLFGLRLINSPDIGYHLDYGFQFLENNQPVDSSLHLYTVSDSQENTANEQLPPCSWRDRKGQFHFPNANWLSQILFALVYRLAGFKGLSVLSALLVFIAVSVSAIMMQRRGIPLYCITLAVLLIAFSSYERFCLRPEMLAFAILTIQLYLFVNVLSREDKLLHGNFFLLLVIHLIFVNVHTYWILSVLLTIAFLSNSVLKNSWKKEARFFRSQKTSALSLLLVGQILVSFINPWTWRLVVLPIQTGVFFLENNIITNQLISSQHPWIRYVTGGGHPWSIINEFLPSFHTGFMHSYATWSFAGVLILSLIALLAAIYTKQWWAILLTIGFMFFSLTMRRNIAPASFILVPVSFMVIYSALKNARSAGSACLPSFGLAWGMSLSLISVLLILAIISNSVYRSGRHSYRFGLGPAYLALPLKACDFLSRTKPKGRIWTDFYSSSNVHFFTRFHPEVPIITNTWAMPTEVMAEVIKIMSGQIPLHQARAKYDFQTAVIHVTPATTIAFPGANEIPLARALFLDRRWELVYLDAAFGVFMFNEGLNSELAKRYRIRFDEEWLDDYIFLLQQTDPVAATAYRSGVFVLRSLGYKKEANTIYQKFKERNNK